MRRLIQDVSETYRDRDGELVAVVSWQDQGSLHPQPLRGLP